MPNARGLENAGTLVLNLVIETTCIYLVSSTNVTLFPVDVILHKCKSPSLDLFSFTPQFYPFQSCLNFRNNGHV